MLESAEPGNEPSSGPVARHRGNARRRVSIICGSVHRYDAISECALACMEAASTPTDGVPTEVRLYCLDSNVGDTRIHVVSSAASLFAQHFYQSSDVIIHHFGIVSALHALLAIAPRAAHVMVQFYGVTPPQFLEKAAERVIEDSFIQIGLFDNADEIVVNSLYLEEELRRIGVARPLRRLELFGVNVGASSVAKARGDGDGRLEVVYCGRFVRSKQVLPLLEALEGCAAEFPGLRLTLVGVAHYSDGGYLDALKSQALAGRLDVRFAMNQSSSEVATLIATADLLVLPSLHEGFGMPVAEALAARTPVVCSDAGSLPETAGGLAHLFAASDPEALKSTLRAALAARASGDVLTEHGQSPYRKWAEKAGTFAAKYQRSAFVARWRAALASVPAGGAATHDAARRCALDSVFPQQHLADPVEAQTIGRITALKALGRKDEDPAAAIDILHRWAFGRPAEGDDFDYWRGFVHERRLDALVAELSRSVQVKESSAGMRSLAGLQATLIGAESERIAVQRPTRAATLPSLTRSEVERILPESRTGVEFVKGAYLLILGRDADSGGLEHYVEMAADRGNWSTILDIFYDSEEFADLTKRRAVDGSR